MGYYWLPGWLQKWPGNVLYDGGLGDLEGLIPWKNRNLGKAPKICGDWRCNLQSSWPWHYFLILWQKIMRYLHFSKSVQLIFSAHLQFFPYCGALHIVVSMFNVFIFSSFSNIHIFWRSQWWANMYFLYRSGTKHDKAVCDTDNWHSYCSNHKTATKIFRSAQVLGFNQFIQQVWYSNHMSIIVSIHATV